MGAQDNTLIENKSKRSWVGFDINLPHVSCFDTDLLAITFTELKQSSRSEIQLFYRNQIVAQFDKQHHVDSKLNSRTTKPQRIVFPLRAQPEWALGNTSDLLQLRIPPGMKLEVHQIESLPSRSFLPQLSAPGSDFYGTKGFLHLSPRHKETPLAWDVKEIRGSKDLALEITRVNQVFEEPNASTPSNFAMNETRLSGATGTTRLRRAQFPQPGLYELRGWALDSSGRHMALSSAHLVVSVDD
jgi:hypothetical protein